MKTLVDVLKEHEKKLGKKIYKISKKKRIKKLRCAITGGYIYIKQ